MSVTATSEERLGKTHAAATRGSNVWQKGSSEGPPQPAPSPSRIHASFTHQLYSTCRSWCQRTAEYCFPPHTGHAVLWKSGQRRPQLGRTCRGPNHRIYYVRPGKECERPQYIAPTPPPSLHPSVAHPTSPLRSPHSQSSPTHSRLGRQSWRGGRRAPPGSPAPSAAASCTGTLPS